MIDLLALFNGMRRKITKRILTSHQIATVAKTETRKTKKTRKIEAKDAAIRNEMRQIRANKKK